MKPKSIDDLDELAVAADAFVRAGEGDRGLIVVKAHYDRAVGEAKVVFRRAGAVAEQSFARATELGALADEIERRFGVGSFELERAYVWAIRYGPCAYYGSSAATLQGLIEAERKKLAALPADWKPLSADEIREAMRER